VSQDDVLCGYRWQLFDFAARTSVSEACRVFGVHRSTYYVWKRRVERHGLEILRPRERRRPRPPNQLSLFVEERIVAFALGHPGFGPRRIASELAKPRWGGLVVSHKGVWRCLRGHGLNTRTKRLSVVTGYVAPYESPREPEPERQCGSGATGRAGRAELLLRRPPLRHERRGLAADRDRRRLQLRLGRARQLPPRQPDRRPDLEARPTGLRRPRRRRLAARTRADRQRGELRANGPSARASTSSAPATP
jgi:transposase